MNKFTKEFRLKAIKLKEKGIHPNDIFTRHGIGTEDKQKDYAGKLIAHWRRVGVGNTPNPQERKKIKILSKIQKQSEKKKIEYLETKIAYLEAENSFLANLPKKKK